MWILKPSGWYLVIIVSLLHFETYGQEQQPNLYVDAQFAFATSKSRLVESNDTGTAFRYGVGSHAGSDGRLGFQLLVDQQTTQFGLNDSSLSFLWQDTTVRYSIGPVYFGPLFTRLEMKCKRAGMELIDAAGAGYGGNLGLFVPIGRDGSLRLDLVSASVAAMKNSLGQKVSVQQRLDVDLSASVDLTRSLLDLVFGFRGRTLSIEADSTYAEAIYQTYAGLRMSFFF